MTDVQGSERFARRQRGQVFAVPTFSNTKRYQGRIAGQRAQVHDTSAANVESREHLARDKRQESGDALAPPHARERHDASGERSTIRTHCPMCSAVRLDEVLSPMTLSEGGEVGRGWGGGGREGKGR